MGKAIDFAPEGREEHAGRRRGGVTFGPTNHDMKGKHDTESPKVFELENRRINNCTQFAILQGVPTGLYTRNGSISY